ncbi:MAG: FhaA domain-containing protein [Coriobacteriales bacterium]
MGLFSRFEDKAEDVIEGAGRGGIEPVKLAKRAAKEMQREKMIGVGHEYAPTLYNVLVSPEDDRRMGGYYPSIAGEIETYLSSRASQDNLVFDCPPLVRFIVDEGLRKGKFDIIAENVSPAIIEELRQEEMEYYGLDSRIDVNPVLRHATSPAPEDDPAELPDGPAEFDPFLPADMQSAHYIPEDAPASQPPAPEPELESEPQLQPEPAASPADAEATVLFSHATAPTGARVCLYDYETDRRYPLADKLVTLGRGSANDITISDPGMSRRHAELLWNGELWMVRDCDSTNGTYLNGEPVTQHILIDGDVIECGTTRLEFKEG